VFNNNFMRMKRRVSKIILKHFDEGVLKKFNQAWEKGHTYTDSVENHLNLIQSFVRIKNIADWCYEWYLSDDFKPRRRQRKYHDYGE